MRIDVKIFPLIIFVYRWRTAEGPRVAPVCRKTALNARRRSPVRRRSGVSAALTVAVAAEQHQKLLTRSISAHTFRHTTAMHLLQSGVNMTVIALWLGHENRSTTHM